MLESRYLKDNIENIQKLLAIPALRNFETKSLQKLLRLSKIREYENGERIFAEYMSIRLRLTNEELITAKKKIKRLLTKI